MTQTEYTLVKTIESHDCIIRVHSPAISEEERKKRLKIIHKAAENLLKGVPTT